MMKRAKIFTKMIARCGARTTKMTFPLDSQASALSTDLFGMVAIMRKTKVLTHTHRARVATLRASPTIGSDKSSIYVMFCSCYVHFISLEVLVYTIAIIAAEF